MLDAVLLGKAIRRVREEKNLSQEVVSGLAGIGRTHLSAIERGARKPTMETFFCLCEAMNIRPSYLMQRVEDEIAKSGKK